MFTVYFITKSQCVYPHDVRYTDNDETKLPKKARSRRMKIFEASMNLNMFIWREYPNPFNLLILDFLRYCAETQKFQKNKVSSTINNMFKEKKSFRLFCEMVSKHLSHTLFILSKHQTDIINAIKAEYKNFKCRSNAHSEFNNYQTMINVAISDWGQISEKANNLILDATVNAQVFYTFIDSVFRRATETKSAAQIFFDNPSLNATLESNKKKMNDSDEAWLNLMFPDYNHLEFMKEQNALKRYNKASNDDTESEDEHLIKTNKKRGVKKGKGKGIDLNAIKKWQKGINDRIKQDEYGKVGQEHCALHHCKDMKCSVTKTNAKNQCRTGGVFRSHSCLCGSRKHIIDECKVIFK